ncbi:2-phosphosulfolactate phosphatase [Martelella sp. HB161492]|uniref:2-phosphosulfolactate phosphatase n=1 Tax=Martelella sp. HB161492 TaxID=2720726 RepID=UPI00158FC9F9|nr:2-phosphosulfolactate phosphatase [Martelella sp. HB161492]
MPQTIHCEWGMAGLQALKPLCSVIIIVDVLSFSTAVDIAVASGATVLPFPLGDRRAAEQAAARANAELAYPRSAQGGQYSLSPASLARIPAGTRLMLPSPNGSRLSFAASAERAVLSGALRNSKAVADAALALANGGDIGVIPAGEMWPDGSLRPAIEDWLGAGAIIAAMQAARSSEAALAAMAWHAAETGFPGMIRNARSGIELSQRGYAGDIDIAIEHDASDTAPVLIDGAFRSVAECRQQASPHPDQA